MLSSPMPPAAARQSATSEGARFQHNPYQASVLPRLAPQPPQSIATKPQLAPTHVHHNMHHYESALPRVGGFASRKKGEISRAQEIMKGGYAYVRFKHSLHCFSCAFQLHSGDYVVVEADRGINIGLVERVLLETPDGLSVPDAIRVASNDEAVQLTALRLEERTIRQFVQDTADSLGLPMSVVDVELQFDRNKLIVYFESRDIVDFRRLQRILFRNFGCRIWLTQWKDVASSGAPR